MRAFACPVCSQFAAFDADRCPHCATSLGLHLPSRSMVPNAAALRRLIYQLDDIGLPIDPFSRRDGGLAFDLLSSYTTGEKVIIGHAGGAITIDLVENGSGADLHLQRCRELFGDERIGYRDDIARHYLSGAPAGWAETFISEYATMHPWEDFAECFAHYLHVADTIDTSREAGTVLLDWRWTSMFFNRVNTAVGKDPLYPFEIPPAVADELGFIHRVVRETASGGE